MDKWSERSPEIAYLLNPAFCSLILNEAITEYKKKTNTGMPFPLIYLVLPLVLHKYTRTYINYRTNMVTWIREHQSYLIGFPKRTRSLVPFTNEALENLLAYEIIEIQDQLLIPKNKIKPSKLKSYKDANPEIKECMVKAQHIGRWFAKSGSVKNIYIAWGIRP